METLPDTDKFEGLSPEEYIVSFYKALGWQPKTELDPKRIVINEDQWREICRHLNEVPTDHAPGGYVWMNWGPAAHADVPYGKVIIAEGAFEKGNEQPQKHGQEPEL